MKQKILKVGNSAAVTIPKKWLDELGLQPGDEVVVNTDRVGEKLEVYSVRGKVRSDSGITPEFLDIVKGINKRYGKVLKKLADK